MIFVGNTFRIGQMVKLTELGLNHPPGRICDLPRESLPGLHFVIENILMFGLQECECGARVQSFSCEIENHRLLSIARGTDGNIFVYGTTVHPSYFTPVYKTFFVGQKVQLSASGRKELGNCASWVPQSGVITKVEILPYEASLGRPKPICQTTGYDCVIYIGKEKLSQPGHLYELVESDVLELQPITV